MRTEAEKIEKRVKEHREQKGNKEALEDNRKSVLRKEALDTDSKEMSGLVDTAGFSVGRRRTERPDEVNSQIFSLPALGREQRCEAQRGGRGEGVHPADGRDD